MGIVIIDRWFERSKSALHETAQTVLNVVARPTGIPDPAVIGVKSGAPGPIQGAMAPIAPPIEGELWLNTDPLNPEHLRGRAVVLVFWSAGCEASLCRLQQIESLVKGRPDEAGDVLAVAVHTPRMTCDDDVGRLQHIIGRHRITMPVVHDPRYLTWTRYEPPGWPSTAVIDRRGRITGIAPGCHDIELIEAALADALARPAGRRRADHEPVGLPSRPEIVDRGNDPQAAVAGDPDRSRLRYPEGVASIARRASTRLAIAESGGDRLIIGRVGPDVQTLRVDLVVTGLDQPSAVAFTDPVTLAVVERGANTVSSIDVATGARSIITEDLMRPVGLAVDIDGSVVITDAADERLYRATANRDSSGHLVLPIAGSGRTGVGSGWADDAELAQPVAAVRTGAGLVFADAASSNLRLLTDGGEVFNITDSDLFDWGLLDGPAHRARLQRPSGVTALPDGSIIVVDSGNNRLRRLHHRRVETMGLRGLHVPTAAVAIDGNRVVVADTGNHRLIATDPIRQDAWPLTVDGLEDARSVDAAPSQTGAQVSSGSATSAT